MQAIADDFLAARRSRRRWARALLASALAVAVTATEVAAQTVQRGRTPSGDFHRPMRGGGLGLGAAIGIGVGLGVLIGRETARSRAEEETPPTRRRRAPENDEDAPRAHRTRGGDAPPRKRTPETAAAPRPDVVVPPLAETRFMPGEILVELREGGSIEAIARRRDLVVLDRRPIRLLGTTLHRLRSKGDRSVAETLRQLRRERTIAHAEPNWVYALQEEAAPTTSAAAASAPPPADEATPMPGQWSGDRIRLGVAHAQASGRGVRVAVIDTAADGAHPELTGAIEASFDALPGVDPTPGAHGTAMAGAVAARFRLAGAAPAARLLAARAFGPPGADGTARGATFEVVACLDWAVDREAQVVSMSFAGPASGVLGRALAAARAKGVVLVAASGNAGAKSEPLHPAATDGVVAVTASDPDDRILPEAVRGRHVAVTAPGVDVLVPTPKGGYDLTTGTSVAAAEVSGVVALLLERRPDLRPDDVARLLSETAVDLGAPGRDPVFGAGLIDAGAAIARAR